MALAKTTIWQMNTAGSDTANGGGFDPGQTAGMFTDGAATSATGNSPVFSSASYNFVAGDVGAWVYIASGSNWTAGWYEIASVASNNATLKAAVGEAQSASTRIPNTAAGCATTGSPTSATWSIDYSRQTTARYAYTDLASAGAGLTVSSAAYPFAKEQVGNAIIIASGTNFTAGVYVIASVAAGVATVVGVGNITTGAGASGTGGQGGSFVSLGKAGAVHVAGNKFYVKSGTYTVTSTSANVAAGCLTMTAQAANSDTGMVIGYATVCGDMGTKPVITADGTITTFTLITVGVGNWVTNVTVDGNSRTSSRGINSNNGNCYNVKGQNCTNSAIAGNAGGLIVACEATGCATAAAITSAGVVYGCYSHDNSYVGMGFGGIYIRCISEGNTGATGRGFDDGFSGACSFYECIAYGNAGDGFRVNFGSGSAPNEQTMSCIAYGNGTYGFNDVSGSQGLALFNCAAGNNTSGATNGYLATSMFNMVTLTGDPFTNAAAGDFSLNNTAGAGAACRAAGFPGVFPGGLTTGYLDIGAVQHQDSGGGSSYEAVAIFGG